MSSPQDFDEGMVLMLSPNSALAPKSPIFTQNDKTHRTNCGSTSTSSARQSKRRKTSVANSSPLEGAAYEHRSFDFLVSSSPRSNVSEISERLEDTYATILSEIEAEFSSQEFFAHLVSLIDKWESETHLIQAGYGPLAKHPILPPRLLRELFWRSRALAPRGGCYPTRPKTMFYRALKNTISVYFNIIPGKERGHCVRNYSELASTWDALGPRQQESVAQELCFTFGQLDRVCSVGKFLVPLTSACGPAIFAALTVDHVHRFYEFDIVAYEDLDGPFPERQAQLIEVFYRFSTVFDFVKANLDAVELLVSEKTSFDCFECIKSLDKTISLHPQFPNWNYNAIDIPDDKWYQDEEP